MADITETNFNSHDTALSTLVSSLEFYKDWMTAMIGVNHTYGHEEASRECAVEAYKAEQVLKTMRP